MAIEIREVSRYSKLIIIPANRECLTPECTTIIRARKPKRVKHCDRCLVKIQVGRSDKYAVKYATAVYKRGKL